MFQLQQVRLSKPVEATPSLAERGHAAARPKTAVREKIDAPAEWRRPLTGATLGLLLFETITGLAIYLLPFSVFNQFGVLLHTLVGLLMIVPIGVYLGQHWWRRFRGNFNHYQLLGYISAAAVLILTVSGAVLTWQAVFGIRIGYIWDLLHIIFSFALVAFLGAHLATLLWRRVNNDENRRALRAGHRVCLWKSLAWSGGLTLVCGALALGYVEDAFQSSFPEGYSFKYGDDRPFAPSLARVDMSQAESRMKARILQALTPEQGRLFAENLKPDPGKHVGVVTVAERLCGAMPLTESQKAQVRNALEEAKAGFRERGAIASEQLAGSEGCGTSGCHSEIVREWLPSAHRYASMDFVFQKVQENMAQELAPEATRYCAGCHDPIALFSGAKNVGNLTLSAEGADEGVSCLACHSIVQTDVRGNGDYTVAVPQRYIFERTEGPAAKGVSDFLIRAYPKQHVTSYMRPLYKTAESCGACHKQFVDEELNDFGWVQGQNQYDSWRKSRWHNETEDSKTVSCRECHMPLLAGNEPASGDKDDRYRHPRDGKHRSHRFLAANQYIPRFLKLAGAEEQCALTVKWLRGEYQVPEIADRWTTGPVVRLALNVPEQARPGEEIGIQTIITNNKAGHDFPTGPMDMIEGWVEVTVTDHAGNIVYASARPDERDYLVNPQIVFKAELIDRSGALIGRHELWHMVGARFKRTLFPGVTDTTTFNLECPSLPSDPSRRARLSAEQQHAFAVPKAVEGNLLKVSAKVWYCKFSAPFLDRLFGEEARMRSEVTDVAWAEAVIPVVQHGLASAE